MFKKIFGKWWNDERWICRTIKLRSKWKDKWECVFVCVSRVRMNGRTGGLRIVLVVTGVFNEWKHSYSQYNQIMLIIFSCMLHSCDTHTFSLSLSHIFSLPMGTFSTVILCRFYFSRYNIKHLLNGTWRKRYYSQWHKQANICKWPHSH